MILYILYNKSGGIASMAKRHGGMTVKDVAARIAPTADDVPSVIAQVRHWTRAGLLKPVDRLHTGTGRWRRYSDDTIYMAALLARLSNLGITVGVLGHFVTWVYVKRSEDTHWQKCWDLAVRGNGDVFLSAAIGVIGYGTYTTQMKISTRKPDVLLSEPLSIVINLSAVFGAVR